MIGRYLKSRFYQANMVHADKEILTIQQSKQSVRL